MSGFQERLKLFLIQNSRSSQVLVEEFSDVDSHAEYFDVTVTHSNGDKIHQEYKVTLGNDYMIERGRVYSRPYDRDYWEYEGNIGEAPKEKQELENAKVFIAEQAKLLKRLSEDGMVAIAVSPHYHQVDMLKAIHLMLDISKIGFSFDDRTFVIHLEE